MTNMRYPPTFPSIYVGKKTYFLPIVFLVFLPFLWLIQTHKRNWYWTTTLSGLSSWMFPPNLDWSFQHEILPPLKLGNWGLSIVLIFCSSEYLANIIYLVLNCSYTHKSHSMHILCILNVSDVKIYFYKFCTLHNTWNSVKGITSKLQLFWSGFLGNTMLYLVLSKVKEGSNA